MATTNATPSYVPLSPQSVFRGTDAEIYMEGAWMSNVSSVEATVEIDQTDLKLLGNWWTVHRNVGLKGTGTIKGVFINTQLMEKIGSITSGKEFRTEIVVKNENPDTGKTYRVRLKNVVFTSIPLGSFTAGDIAQQDFSFTFAGYEFLDKVS
jgi:hypothetical protein